MMTMLPANFTFDDSVADCNVSAKAWIARNNKGPARLDGVAACTLIFNANGRVLLVQRASTDSMPNLWEAPGGAVDDDDASILHGAAREMREETGLVAAHFTGRVTLGLGKAELDVFQNSRRTRSFCRFAFQVEAQSCDAVVLDPKEHQAYVWATEEEVKTQSRGQRKLTITHPAMRDIILEAFRLRRNPGDSYIPN